MDQGRRNTAVLLAGGVGSRVGLELPKQLVRIAGRPIMEHALGVLHAHPEVDEIVIMMAPGHLDAVHAMVRAGGYHKVREILEGADTRSATTMRALAALGEEDRKVLLHDAARPLLTPRIVSDCFEALQQYAAVNVAVPSADTIVEVTGENTVRAVPRRAGLRRVQTPQGFRLSVIREAYRRAAADPEFEATDDCTVVLRYLPQVPIWVVPGEERNMKVTEPIDVHLADTLLRLDRRAALTTRRTEHSYREALRGRTMVVFGGSHGVGAGIADLARTYGANVMTFSRSTTRTHVERREDVQRAATETLEQHGSVDFVVSDTAVLPQGPLMEVSEETLYSSAESSYVAPVLIAQEFLPLLARSRGSLLLSTAASADPGQASGSPLSSAAKAAVVALTRALADEWTDAGVRVNCVDADRTATAVHAQAFDQEPPESPAASVAHAGLEALLSATSGHLIDLGCTDPLTAAR